ncbi:hypothetical protein ACOMHN_000601 [Nucella lapillus]
MRSTDRDAWHSRDHGDGGNFMPRRTDQPRRRRPEAREDSPDSMANHNSRTSQPHRFYPMRHRGASEEAEMRNRSAIDQTMEGRSRGWMK